MKDVAMFSASHHIFLQRCQLPWPWSALGRALALTSRLASRFEGSWQRGKGFQGIYLFSGSVCCFFSLGCFIAFLLCGAMWSFFFAVPASLRLRFFCFFAFLLFASVLFSFLLFYFFDSLFFCFSVLFLLALSFSASVLWFFRLFVFFFLSFCFCCAFLSKGFSAFLLYFWFFCFYRFASSSLVPSRLYRFFVLFLPALQLLLGFCSFVVLLLLLCLFAFLYVPRVCFSLLAL